MRRATDGKATPSGQPPDGKHAGRGACARFAQLRLIDNASLETDGLDSGSGFFYPARCGFRRGESVSSAL